MNGRDERSRGIGIRIAVAPFAMMERSNFFSKKNQQHVHSTPPNMVRIHSTPPNMVHMVGKIYKVNVVCPASRVLSCSSLAGWDDWCTALLFVKSADFKSTS